MLASELDPKTFLGHDTVSAYYPDQDFHKVYFGEVVRIAGTEKYLIK